MNSKLFVGNLSYDCTDTDLQDLFAQHGTVTDVHIPLDRMSGRPRGFAFVTMSTQEEAQEATESLNGSQFLGRPMTVNEARAREERRPPRSGGGGGGGGGGGHRNGGGGGRGRNY